MRTIASNSISTFRLIVCLATFGIVPMQGHGEVSADPPLTAAVLDFQAGDELKGNDADIATLLNAQLSAAAPDVILVERQEIEKVLGEQELGASGTVTPDTAAKLGYLTGAKVLITGRLFSAGDKFYMIAKIIGTETGRVYGESATFNDPSALDKAVGELVPKIAADLKNHADAFVAKVEDPAARLDRLKKVVAAHATLPSVSVVIPEHHVGAVVMDPAAQTELTLTLQQLGFEVIDPTVSKKQPDIEITGEAFSEFAGLRGDLVSCRARMEIRMVRPGSDKLILADRENGVAVDLAEDIAGKSAIESASARLLDRIVPKLVEP